MTAKNGLKKYARAIQDLAENYPDLAPVPYTTALKLAEQHLPAARASAMGTTVEDIHLALFDLVRPALKRQAP